MKHRISNIVRLRAGVIAWLVFGFMVWGFLLTPYALEAANCFDNHRKSGRIACLKPVAKNLRSDSNIATYATATVAAIIALQLSRRASENRPDSSDRLSNGPARN